LIERARGGDDPSVEDRARVRRAVMAAVAGAAGACGATASAGAATVNGAGSMTGAAGMATVTGASTSLGTPLAAKVAAVVLAVSAAGGVITGAVTIVQRPRATEPEAQAAGATIEPSPSARRAPARARTAVPDARDLNVLAEPDARDLNASADAPAAIDETLVVDGDAPAIEPARAAHESAVVLESPLRVLAGDPVIEAPRAPATANAAPARPARAPRVLATTPVARAGSAPADARAPDAGEPARLASTLDGELALVRAAWLALRAGRVAEALVALDDHAHRFPAGVLAPERDAARAVALCRAGRSAEGARAAEAFLAAHPRSPLASRVRASCIR
jgi:hypothetical protein